jgi:predicted protein tyrosine phosphatase
MKIYRIAEEIQQERTRPVAYVFSLQSLVSNLPDIVKANINVISIRDPLVYNKEYEAIDKSGIKNLFVATFDDLATDEEKNKNPYTFPKQTDIQGILEWAKQKWGETHKVFAVHCTAGVSRSSAIAILINQMIMNDYNKVFDPKYHSPNTRILEYGEEYLKTNHIKEDIEKRTKEYDKEQMDKEMF